MNICLPSDFKKSTIDILKKLEYKYPGNKIVEVYGNIPNGEVIGSGRGTIENSSQITSLEKLKEYVYYVRENNIDFNYTMNAGCTGNFDITSYKIKKILDFIYTLEGIGVNKLTIASPALIELVHKNFPGIAITASTIASVNSVKRAKFITDLGASAIALQEDLTRNFSVVRSISENVDVKLEMIVNSMCLSNCPLRKFHYNCLSHFNGKNKDEFIQYYTNHCYLQRRKDLSEYIKSPWIRPEDIDFYKEQGVDLFKFVGRERIDRMNIEKMLTCYFKRSFEGNLDELIYGFSEKSNIYIDNKKLDGFINHFKDGYKCNELCGTEKCNYCSKYSDRAVSVLKSQNSQIDSMEDFRNYGITSPITIKDMTRGLC